MKIGDRILRIKKGLKGCRKGKIYIVAEVLEELVRVKGSRTWYDKSRFFNMEDSWSIPFYTKDEGMMICNWLNNEGFDVPYNGLLQGYISKFGCYSIPDTGKQLKCKLKIKGKLSL